MVQFEEYITSSCKNDVFMKIDGHHSGMEMWQKLSYLQSCLILPKSRLLNENFSTNKQLTGKDKYMYLWKKGALESCGYL